MKNLSVILICILSVCSCIQEQREGEASILPQPKEININDGCFTICEETTLCIKAAKSDSATIAGQFNTPDMKLCFAEKEPSGNCIVLKICDSIDGISSSEGYSIEISEDKVTAKALSGAGLFYATQTLLQLRDNNKFPVCKITDEPEFTYRGMMLDVSRHFFGKEFIKKQIDAMARFKMNRLHLHLTDAAGWRIEIKRYPRLTQFAAWRKPAEWKDWWFGNRMYVEEGTEDAYGGYYTQEDIREIVAYAESRHITIIPEIEMPAHSEEVLTAYPELSCTHEPYKQADFCVGNEKSFEFLENVLTEIFELFPSEYIHIGGDEAGKMAWGSCPLCQKRMKEESLAGTEELQSYFIKRIEKFANSRGRQIIGWDEILEGGLAPNATVMSWRGTEGGIAAAAKGHKAIMVPGGYCYLDSYQDAPLTQPMAFGPYLPLEKVYSYNPTAGLEEEQAKMIYGIQGNLWTEYIPEEELVEYMLYPRMLAIAEIGWSNPTERDYDNFKRRAITAVDKLRTDGYNAFDLKNEQGERGESLTPAMHLAVGKKVAYATGAEYNSKYNAGGDTALVDGVRGGWTYIDHKWQGFIRRGGVDVTIDLGEKQEIKSIGAEFMQMPIPEVWLPAEVVISISDNNADFTEIARIVHKVTDENFSLKTYSWQGRCNARYVRYRAKQGAKGGWLFTDEIIIK